MASAAAQAIAVATAVSGDSLSDDESEIIIMPNDLKVQQDINLKTRNNIHFRRLSNYFFCRRKIFLHNQQQSDKN